MVYENMFLLTGLSYYGTDNKYVETIATEYGKPDTSTKYGCPADPDNLWHINCFSGCGGSWTSEGKQGDVNKALNRNFTYIVISETFYATYKTEVESYIISGGKIYKLVSKSSGSGPDGHCYTITFEKVIIKKPLINGCGSLGDILDDGYIGSDDVDAIAEYVAEIRQLTTEQLKRADVTGNGTIDSIDVTQIAQYVAGTRTTFMPCSSPCTVKLNNLIGLVYDKNTKDVATCLQLMDLNKDGIINYKDLSIMGSNTETQNCAIIKAYDNCTGGTPSTDKYYDCVSGTCTEVSGGQYKNDSKCAGKCAPKKSEMGNTILIVLGAGVGLGVLYYLTKKK